MGEAAPPDGETELPFRDCCVRPLLWLALNRYAEYCSLASQGLITSVSRAKGIRQPMNCNTCLVHTGKAMLPPTFVGFHGKCYFQRLRQSHGGETIRELGVIDGL